VLGTGWVTEDASDTKVIIRFPDRLRTLVIAFAHLEIEEGPAAS